MSDSLSLYEKIQCVDLNYTELWDSLDETQQKDLKKEFFILNRYISSVGKPKRGKAPTLEQQQHYVLTVNEFYNKHWFDLQKHPKLLWLLLCMCNYDGSTTFYHQWIGLKRKTDNKKYGVLAKIYPTAKIADLEVLMKLTPTKELEQLAEDHGFANN